ncbi:MAG: hypothetical protein JWN42_1531, partial [Candidatus Angelobacter sp.]|nr:hypothetical protein [Candidatus Angelobacter sp.]
AADLSDLFDEDAIPEKLKDTRDNDRD